MSDLKVYDLVDFNERHYNIAKDTMRKLDALCLNYSNLVNISSPQVLEDLKRKFVGHMSTMTAVYAKIKAFKGSNHIYLEDARKEFKAKAYKQLREGYTDTSGNMDVYHESVNATEAGVTVYDHPYYKERLALMEDLKAFFIKVDEKFAFYSTVLQLIQQTISIISKEYEYSRYTSS